MVRLKAPLFSMEASGTIGNAIVFSKWKGRDYARRHTVPANPRSGLQVGIRSVFAFVSQNFINLDPLHLSAWQEIAEGQALTPLNAYIRDAVSRARMNLGWRADPAGDAGDEAAAPSAVESAAFLRSIRIDFTSAAANGTPPADYCCAIHRVEGATFAEEDVDISNLVGVVPTPLPSVAHQFTDVGLTTGQAYSYRLYHVAADGGLGAQESELNVQAE